MFNKTALVFVVSVYAVATILLSATWSLAQEEMISIPAGTVMMVETNSAVSSGQHGTGHRFQSTLIGDLVAPDGTVVAPNGSTVFGILTNAQKSGRVVGQAELVIGFDSIMVNNRRIPIATSQVQAVTEGTGGRSVRQVGRAAAIGGLIDGKGGARTGAKVGAGAAIVSGGNQVNVPAGTMLEIRLDQAAQFPKTQ